MTVHGHPRLRRGCRSGDEKDALFRTAPGEAKTAPGDV
jgi:hypothetical protein